MPASVCVCVLWGSKRLETCCKCHGVEAGAYRHAVVGGDEVVRCVVVGVEVRGDICLYVYRGSTVC